ncbi:LysM peptidoglycan-binding domain-containing protein [Terracoccus luteus]|uniref:LysM repeat protein n=1 Tax=Terracoccus luteus TaxID=53356 RepID=A0A839PPC4_9MICO|nr:LysM peptidoglycan-binding domain-containing protein [Terracoccus luteus]MBB2984929.1 LysM repeat protein [Terracoccus luteus]MCP2170581.1 LysM repeat protein [Terracoccus luteus]
MPFAADAVALAPAHAYVAPVTTGWKTITLRPGDTVWDLALRHHTTPAQIVAKNRLADGGRMVHPGQRLLVPGTAAGSSAPSKPATAGRPSSAPAGSPASSTPSSSLSSSQRVYTVVRGDTLYGIAGRYKVSLTKLMSANGLRGSSILRIGQRVVVPGTGAPSGTKPGTSTPTRPTPSKPAPSRPTTPTTWPDATKATVAQSKARLAATAVPSRTQTAAMIRATALRHGVDPRLALAVGWRESSWNQRSVSYVNALGVMQVMPTSGIWASQLAGRTLDLYDAQDNITAGVLILRSLQSQADSREQAVGAYYQGLYSVRKNGMFTSTKAYVASVLELAKTM